jgi:transposase
MKNQYDYVIGVDISKDTFHSRILSTKSDSVISIDKISKFDNSFKGFTHFFNWLSKLNICSQSSLVVMEATGIYWEKLAFHCVEKENINVSVVNPKQIKHFALTNLRRSKTDPLDADLIARFGIALKPPIWNPPHTILEELKQISRERDSFVKMLTEERNRLHAITASANPSSIVLKSHRAVIKHLEKQIKKLEEVINKKLDNNSSLKDKKELLKTIPGIGDISATVLLTETNGFSTFTDPKQLAAYAGISPCQHESGSSVSKKPKISKVGNSKIRSTLYLSSLSSIRSDSPFKRFYERLREKGKPAKVALIAVARKLLHVIFAIIKSGKAFDPLYISTKHALTT